MRPVIGILFSLLLLITGCVSKREANLEKQQAYLAGQQAAQRSQSPPPPQVTVQGPVQNPVIPWTPDLTVAKAIVDANYTGFMTPVFVRVIRKGQMVEELKGVDLLHHQDFPLEPGDLIILIGGR